LAQRNTSKTLPDAIKNVTRETINSCCKNCPLLPSKPNHRQTSQVILAAADSAARLKRQLESGMAQIIYGPNDISARRAAALDAYIVAESRSDKERFSTTKKSPEKREIPSFE
jgi:hypothetical protein